jgi:hypothetical protein
MAVANTELTYGDVSRKEDVVLNAIEILTAQENQIFNKLGRTVAIDEVHSFLVDTLDTPGTLAYAQGADFSNAALTTPTRLTNIVQEIAKKFAVSKKQQAVEHYHGQNELERQTTKGLKDWANSAEFDLVRSTLVSGASGTTAKMNGIIAAISKSTNTTVQTSGTVFSASILDGLMANNWTNSNGDVATDLYVGAGIRQTIDYFVQKSNVVVNSPDISTIVRTVTTYATAFGTIDISTHRYVQQSGDATARVLAVRPEKLKTAFLTKPMIMTDLSKAGAYDPRACYGSFTLEVRNQDSNFFASGYLK